MKKWIFFATALFVFQKWDSIDHYLNPLPDYAEQHNKSVVLYSTAWCGYCKKTRSLLEAQGIDFFEYDIEKSSEGLAQYKSLGGNGIPLLVLDKKVIKGYSPKSIKSYAKNIRLAKIGND